MMESTELDELLTKENDSERLGGRQRGRGRDTQKEKASQEDKG